MLNMVGEIDISLSWASRRLRRQARGAPGRFRPAAVSSFVQSEPNSYAMRNLANLFLRLCLRWFRLIGRPRKRTQSKPIAGVKRACMAKVSSDVSNKANYRRFWAENRGGLQKQSQSRLGRIGGEVPQAGGLASDGREATMIQSRRFFRDISGVTGPGGRPMRMRRIAAKGGLP